MTKNRTVLLSLLAVTTTTAVNGYLSLAGHSNDLTPYSQGSGVSQRQINRLRYYATTQNCSADGCMLSVDQSSGAILSLLGGAAQFDELRNVYPIKDSDDGVSAPANLIVYFRSDGEEPARADKIWIPVFARARTPAPRVAPISGRLSTPASIPPVSSSILPVGMSQADYQRERRADYFRDWGSN